MYTLGYHLDVTNYLGYFLSKFRNAEIFEIYLILLKLIEIKINYFDIVYFMLCLSTTTTKKKKNYYYFELNI